MVSVPDIFWSLLTLGSGPLVGSFIAAASLRLPARESVVFARSRCDACRRTLGALEIVPIVSHLALGGQCRTCKAPISRRHLALELAGLSIGAFSVLAFDGSTSLAAAVLGWQLLLLAVLDAEHYWLPRALTLSLAVSGLVEAVLLESEGLVSRLIGLGAGYTSLKLIALTYRLVRRRDGLGGGDAYLLAGIGAWLGWRPLPAVVLLAAAAGITFLIALRLAGRKVGATTAVPFGVLLAPAAWIVWLGGRLA